MHNLAGVQISAQHRPQLLHSEGDLISELRLLEKKRVRIANPPSVCNESASLFHMY